ncbi:MAG: 4Fe-4S binding protein [Anaerolineae bacterium]|nr:4Fe-4S binding protein [Anaerolineae bacterium]
MNLVQLALTVEKLTKESPPVTVDPMLCLHSRNKNATCDICVRACPVGAIQLDGKPEVDTEACIRCGLCLHNCPTGAFEGRNNTYRLLRCAEQLVDREVIEVACSMHPTPAIGDGGVDAVIVTDGCLSALGPSAYAGLLALGVGQVRVRLDACAQCPLAMLQPHIQKTLSDVEALPGVEGRVDVAAVPQRTKKRTVFSVKNPPMSRRGFFKKLSRQDVTSAADIAPNDVEHVEGQHAPRERQQLLNALRVIAPPQAPVAGEGFTHFSISSDCTACAVCARVCPTGALQFEKQEDTFQITFASGDCVDCGLCMSYCEPGALQEDGLPIVQELVDSTPELLHAGELHRCSRCGMPFAGDSQNGLCPVCAFRRNNPFGRRVVSSS